MVRAAVLISVLICSAAFALLGQSSPAAHFGTDELDQSTDPCEDFYQYACGNWIRQNPIPPDRSRFGAVDVLVERNLTVLRSALEAPSGPADDAAARKIRDYYAACVDESAIGSKGLGPLAPILARISGLNDKRDLPRLLAELHPMGVDAFFSFGASADPKDARLEIAATDQGGLGLPERDYYFRDGEKANQIRAAYVAHIEKMLELLGHSPVEAKSSAQEVMKLETELAEMSMDVVSRRDPQKLYNPSTREGLIAGSKSFAWQAYLDGIGAPSFKRLNHSSPDFIRGMDAVIDKTALNVIRDYLVWQSLHAFAIVLPQPFQGEEFDFYSAQLRGTKTQRPRWKRCVALTDEQLGEALGQVYVKTEFGPQSKARVRAMVKALETSLHQDIDGLDWMSAETKKQAIEKLNAVVDKIGYPDHWRDYSSYEVARDDALGNLVRGNIFEYRRQLNKIGKPVDRSEWDMTPPTVNAQYSADQNDITFPAGILQSPLFDPRLDDAVNFGAIGAVIGHELTHGFDDEGRQFDRDGNLKDWWTPADAKAFDERAQCLVDEYSSFVAVEDVKVNGKLTLGENTADNGGLRIAHAALLSTLNGTRESIEGFSPEQRFFLGFAHAWCQNQTPEAVRLQATTDPHSPGKWRVNGTVQNMPEFQKAFGCKAKQSMVKANACRVW